MHKSKKAFIREIFDNIVSVEFPEWEDNSPLIRKNGDKNKYKRELAKLLEDIIINNRYNHKDGRPYHYSFSKKNLLDKIFRDRKDPNDKRNEEGVKRLFDILYTGNRKRGTTHTYILKPWYRATYFLTNQINSITYCDDNGIELEKPKYALPKYIRDYIGQDITTKIFINIQSVGIAITQIERFIDIINKSELYKREDLLNSIRLFLSKELEDSVKIHSYNDGLNRLIYHFNGLKSIQLYSINNSISNPHIYQQYTEKTKGSDGNGRLWNSLEVSSVFNIQTMSKVIRKIILTDIEYIEYDINNCHINILSQYYKMVFGSYDNRLEQYCRDYDSYRKNIEKESGVDYKLVKDAVLAITYGGQFLTAKQIINLNSSSIERFQIWNKFIEYYTDEGIARQKLLKLHHSPTFIEVYEIISGINRRFDEASKNGIGIYGEYIDCCINPAWKEIGENEKQNKKLSHLFQGIEAISIRAIIKDDPDSIVSIHHDGWIGKKKRYRETTDEIAAYKKHLRERVYTETKRIMMDWNNRLGRPLPHPDGFNFEFSSVEISGMGNINCKAYIPAKTGPNKVIRPKYKG